MIKIYCNNCAQNIPNDEETYCEQCNVPLHQTCANYCLTCGKVLCDTCFSDGMYKCSECADTDGIQQFKVIRRSHIELFNTCPYALYLTIVKEYEIPDNEYALVGTLIHEYIEKIIEGAIHITQAQQECIDYINEHFKSSDLYERHIETSIKSLETFNEIKDSFGKNPVVEKNIIYSIDEGLPSISCTLDRIDFIDGKIHVSDWKTGKPMSGKKLIEDLQPPLYIEAIKQEYGEYPETFTLYYLAHKKSFQYIRNEDGTYTVKTSRNEYVLNIPEHLERTRDILIKINNGQFIMHKDVHQWYCKNMCYFYKSGICMSTSKEQWKVLNEQYK